MKKVNLFSPSNGIFMFSLSSLILLAFFVIPSSVDVQPDVEKVTEVVEEEFHHCPRLFSSANTFCPGSYSISGYLNTANGCEFEWLGAPNCSGITANVSQNGNWITISGSGSSGSFCKFRYRLSDDHGWSQVHLVGVRIRQSSDPICCTVPPCQ